MLAYNSLKEMEIENAFKRFEHDLKEGKYKVQTPAEHLTDLVTTNVTNDANNALY